MEETGQQEGQEAEYKNSNDDGGGIRRRLRDRDLLRKRKAEAEEKETNQAERQRKRPRAGERGGTKRRGRPRKSEPPPEAPPVSQEEGASAQQGGAVPGSVGVVAEQKPGSVTPSSAAGADQPPEAQPGSVLTTSAFTPRLGSFFAPLLTSPAPVYQSAGLLSPSAPAPPPPISAVDAAPVPVQAPDPVPVQAQEPDAIPVPTLSQPPVPIPTVPAPVSAGPPQIERLITESQDRETLSQVLIEGLGPDEDEEDMLELQDLTEAELNTVPEQNKTFSIPTSAPPQEYLPGNSY